MKKIVTALSFLVIVFFLITYVQRDIRAAEAAEKKNSIIVVKIFKYNTEARSYSVGKRINKELAALLEKELAKIDGVYEVLAARGSNDYEIRLKRCLVFEWDDIQPAIIKCLERHIYNDKKSEIRTYREKY